MNNLLGQGKEEAKKVLKKKILAWLAGLIAPAIPFILGALAIVVAIIIIFAPLTMAKDSSESNNNDDAGFFEKFDNFLSGNGWTSDEKAFFQIMQKNNLNCKQSTLVTATILYYYQFYLNENLEYGEEPIDPPPADTSDTTDDVNSTVQQSDDMYSDIPYGQVLPDLKRLVKSIKKGNNAYEKYVKETFLKQSPYNKLLEGYDDEQARLDELYVEIKQIADTIECVVGGGSYIGATCSFNVNGETATDIKVRILRCGNLDGDYSPLENEELIDFEKYITGVVYPEVGAGAPLETMKAQAVAARSYAIARSLGKGDIQEENGQTILSIKSCTADQAYCDPDAGCWSYVDGGEMNWGTRAGVDASIHSGEDTTKKWHRPPLPEDSLIRQAVSETVGETLVNSDGRPVLTSYGSGTQNTWSSMANNGSDYYEILMNTYNDIATDVASNCTLSNTSASGDFTNWKQFDPNWASIPLGNRTIKAIGCAATSVAIQIARSGTATTIENFNPGTFVETMSANGGFTSGGAIYWQKVTEVIASNFNYIGQIALSGNKTDKINQIREQINRGNRYLIVSVKNDGHWVAVNYVTDDNVYIFDPGSSTNNTLWPYYTVGGTLHASIYEKTD